MLHVYVGGTYELSQRGVFWAVVLYTTPTLLRRETVARWSVWVGMN